MRRASRVPPKRERRACESRARGPRPGGKFTCTEAYVARCYFILFHSVVASADTSIRARVALPTFPTRRRSRSHLGPFGRVRVPPRSPFHRPIQHHFVVTSYSHPTYCGHCGKLLWGLMKQGWQCVDCKFNLHKSGDRTGHKNCHREFSHQCPGTVIVKPRSGSFRKEKEKVDGDASPQKPSALNRPSGPDGKADLAHRTGSTSSNSFAAVPSYRKRSMYLMPGQSSENIASDVDDDDSDSDDESFKQPLQIGPDGILDLGLVWPFCKQFSARQSPYARRVVYSTWCPCLLSDWCLQSDVVTIHGVQVSTSRRCRTRARSPNLSALRRPRRSRPPGRRSSTARKQYTSSSRPRLVTTDTL